ncbi:hypothetical protein NC653_030092 [Populus alba x Populus x berolinensis]|uniref:Uncharacterized protein n=1 Tax=Populus alba x Populus x berolinensis TaxID=444605 RepID=A0AAD6Q1P1_9ROSI|nr:hypothetical protein NC653_030092 [Populus alba x Populus x berolinensis]
MELSIESINLRIHKVNLHSPVAFGPLPKGLCLFHLRLHRKRHKDHREGEGPSSFQPKMVVIVKFIHYIPNNRVPSWCYYYIQEHSSNDLVGTFCIRGPMNNALCYLCHSKAKRSQQLQARKCNVLHLPVGFFFGQILRESSGRVCRDQ